MNCLDQSKNLESMQQNQSGTSPAQVNAVQQNKSLPYVIYLRNKNGLSRPHSNKNTERTLLRCHVLGNGQLRSQSSRIAAKKAEISKNQMYPSYIMDDSEECHNKVVFVRHGQSVWNKASKFSGWVDVPLNEIGEQEAVEAGRQLKDMGYHFDVSYTSLLCRATKTNDIILEQMGLTDQCQILQSWRLNERHYGAL